LLRAADRLRHKRLARTECSNAAATTNARMVPRKLTLAALQVKTRLQSKGTPHTTSLLVMRHVLATDGVAGLWKGTVPSAVRAAALTASQCVSYDIIKRQFLMATLDAPDTCATHVAASALSGLVSTTITSPVDVLKTRMFTAGAAFSGPLACAADVWARDGVCGFFKVRILDSSHLLSHLPPLRLSPSHSSPGLDRQLRAPRAADHDHVRGRRAAAQLGRPEGDVSVFRVNFQRYPV